MFFAEQLQGAAALIERLVGQTFSTSIDQQIEHNQQSRRFLRKLADSAWRGMNAL
jgi:hypothetical protein